MLTARAATTLHSNTARRLRTLVHLIQSSCSGQHQGRFSRWACPTLLTNCCPLAVLPSRGAAEFAKGQIRRLLTGRVDMNELAMSGWVGAVARQRRGNGGGLAATGNGQTGRAGRSGRGRVVRGQRSRVHGWFAGRDLEARAGDRSSAHPRPPPGPPPLLLTTTTHPHNPRGLWRVTGDQARQRWARTPLICSRKTTPAAQGLSACAHPAPLPLWRPIRTATAAALARWTAWPPARPVPGTRR